MVKKLSYKLTLTYGLIFFIAIAAVDFLIIVQYRNNQFNRMENMYAEVASVLAAMAGRNIQITNFLDLNENGYTESFKGRVILLDTGKNVISDSRNEFTGQKIDNNEIRTALKNGKKAIGYYKMDGKRMVMFAYPVIPSDHVTGVVLISAFVQEVYDEVGSFSMQIIGISIMVSLLHAVISIIMGKRITKPIVTLNSAALQIQQGNLNTTVKVNNNDEIGILAGTFNIMSQELHRIDTGRKRFVSDVSHELKTPLASIKALLDYVRNGEEDVEVYKEYLTDIDGEIDRLAGLVKSLLAASKLEEVQPRTEEINVYGETASVFKILAPIAYEKGIRLVNNCAQEVVLYADRSMFKEVLINLIDNGIKYGIRQGFVCIGCERGTEGTVITIEDNGCGIPQEDIPHIFENFYRVDAARSGNITGSGVGLYIVKKIADLHGWDICVDSVPGKGTVVRIKAV